MPTILENNNDIVAAYAVAHSKPSVQELKFTSNTSTIIEWVLELFETILDTNRHREYNYGSPNPHIDQYLQGLQSGINEFGEASIGIAKLLHREEQSAQKRRADGVPPLLEGALFVATLIKDSKRFIVISKIDSQDYFNQDTFELEAGLPKKGQVYRSALLTIENGQVARSICSYARNQERAYWWDNFLKLNQIRTDEELIERCWNALKVRVFSKYMDKFPADTEMLRNHVLTTLRTPSPIDYGTMLSDFFLKKDFLDPNFPAKHLHDLCERQPEQYGFERQFTGQRGVVSAQLTKQRIQVHPNLSLHVTDSLESLKDIVSTFEDSTGKNGISIESQIAFQRFKGLV